MDEKVKLIAWRQPFTVDCWTDDCFIQVTVPKHLTRPIDLRRHLWSRCFPNNPHWQQPSKSLKLYTTDDRTLARYDRCSLYTTLKRSDMTLFTGRRAKRRCLRACQCLNAAVLAPPDPDDSLSTDGLIDRPQIEAQCRPDPSRCYRPIDVSGRLGLFRKWAHTRIVPESPFVSVIIVVVILFVYRSSVSYSKGLPTRYVQQPRRRNF